MSSSTKKFKHVKAKAAEDAEEFSYDELEAAKTEKARVSAKRKSTSSTISTSSIDSKKKRTSNASTTSSKTNLSQKSKVSTGTVTKHHYPNSEYIVTDNAAQQMEESSTHRELLKTLLEDIVAQERSNLQTFAQSNGAKSLHGKKYIFESLEDVLSNLVEEVNQSCPPEVVFEPELAKSERSELRPLLETRRFLEEHSRRLEAYENDIGKLVVDHDLWLGSQVVAEKISQAAKVSENSSGSSRSESDAKNHYQQLLGALEHHCAQIISSTEESAAVVTQARQIQDKLYDAFNKARLEAAGAKAPKDAKDILKRMPNLF